MDKLESTLALPRRWARFIKERFEPISTLTMIFLFYLAHLCLMPKSLIDSFVADPLTILAIFFAVVFFFFKLRLYDEIKDYQLDVVINPTRPLPRGLLTHRHLHMGISFLILGEMALFYLAGDKGLFSLSVAIGYSLLMYKEFFIPELIRPHLTTYAMSHTIVTVLLGMAIFSGLFKLYPWDLPASILWFVLNNWFMFNIFEFGRKTFAASEEREGVESYSKIFSRVGAVLLVLSQAISSSFCLWKMGVLLDGVFLFSLVTTGLLGVVGIIFVARNTPSLAKFYRVYSSLHIVIFYSGFIVLNLLNR